MFFVLLRADRYAGILEADGGFALFPINGPFPAEMGEPLRSFLKCGIMKKF